MKKMLFAVTYKGNIEAVFFEIWNAVKYVNNCFDKYESNFVDIKKIKDHNFNEFKDVLQLHIVDDTTHHCENCARVMFDCGTLICDFTKKEVNFKDYCVHYV